VNDDSEVSYIDVPNWVWALILGGAIVGCILTITPAGTAANEYLNIIKLGILNALSTTLVYLTYLGYKIKDLIGNTVLKFFVQYGEYVVPNLQEMLFTPITGLSPINIISLGLRNLAVLVPALEPYIAPVIAILDQLTYQEVAQKLNEFLNKK